MSIALVDCRKRRSNRLVTGGWKVRVALGRWAPAPPGGSNTPLFRFQMGPGAERGQLPHALKCPFIHRMLAHLSKMRGLFRCGSIPPQGLSLGILIALLSGVLACEGLRGARLYSQGTQALDRGDTARAIQDLEAASRLAPGRSDVFNHLGIAYWEAGKPEAARVAFERAVDLDCTNQAAEENLKNLGVERPAREAPAGQ